MMIPRWRREDDDTIYTRVGARLRAPVIPPRRHIHGSQMSEKRTKCLCSCCRLESRCDIKGRYDTARCWLDQHDMLIGDKWRTGHTRPYTDHACTHTHTHFHTTWYREWMIGARNVVLFTLSNWNKKKKRKLRRFFYWNTLFFSDLIIAA